VVVARWGIRYHTGCTIRCTIRTFHQVCKDGISYGWARHCMPAADCASFLHKILKDGSTGENIVVARRRASKPERLEVERQN
jgi:hypothetical protein